MDPVVSLPVYTDTFATLGWWGVGIGVAVMVVAPWVNRLVHEGSAATSKS